MWLLLGGNHVLLFPRERAESSSTISGQRRIGAGADAAHSVVIEGREEASCSHHCPRARALCRPKAPFQLTWALRLRRTAASHRAAVVRYPQGRWRGSGQGVWRYAAGSQSSVAGVRRGELFQVPPPTLEQVFADPRRVKPWEIEILRRSVVMLPPGRSAGAMSREQALASFDQIVGLEQETARYREVIEKLKQLAAEAP
jgi:hypothetical protein